MEEKKKTINKTVNRTGKSLVKKALVVNSKKQSRVNTEQVKKLNEEVKAKKERAKKEISEKTSVEEIGAVEVQQKPDKKYDLTIDMKDMLAAGSHLGHKVAKTHPKARDYIYTSKDGVEILDLTNSINELEKACNYIYNAKRNGKQVLMVGTKRQAREVVKRVAEDAQVAYVTDRWLGGTITNWEEIRKNIKRLKDLKQGIEAGTFSDLTKKELSDTKKEIGRLERNVGGLVNLDKMFDILFVVDAGFEKTAVREARLRGIKVVALVDTDSNPEKVDYPIPANDDSVKSVNLIVEEVGRAIKAAGV
ncbi:MAG: 30S ribosomal protein S2 [Patescibacteria group bacterium]|jgi:small subunit ribosomal protein S2